MHVNAYKRKMARLAGLEPATLEFEARYSIQLSYERAAGALYQRPCMGQGILSTGCVNLPIKSFCL